MQLSAEARTNLGICVDREPANVIFSRRTVPPRSLRFVTRTFVQTRERANRPSPRSPANVVTPLNESFAVSANLKS